MTPSYQWGCCCGEPGTAWCYITGVKSGTSNILLGRFENGAITWETLPTPDGGLTLNSYTHFPIAAIDIYGSGIGWTPVYGYQQSNGRPAAAEYSPFTGWGYTELNTSTEEMRSASSGMVGIYAIGTGLWSAGRSVAYRNVMGAWERFEKILTSSGSQRLICSPVSQQVWDCILLSLANDTAHAYEYSADALTWLVSSGTGGSLSSTITISASATPYILIQTGTRDYLGHYTYRSDVYYRTPLGTWSYAEVKDDGPTYYWSDIAIDRQGRLWIVLLDSEYDDDAEVYPYTLQVGNALAGSWAWEWETLATGSSAYPPTLAQPGILVGLDDTPFVVTRSPSGTVAIYVREGSMWRSYDDDTTVLTTNPICICTAPIRAT